MPASVLYGTREILSNAEAGSFELAAVRKNQFFCFMEGEFRYDRTVAVSICAMTETMCALNFFRLDTNIQMILAVLDDKLLGLGKRL